MSRRPGTFTMGSNLEVLLDGPFDARERVQLKADLTDANSFPYSYIGMSVFVVEEKKRYTLIAEDTTDINSWQLDASSSSGGGGELQAGITVKEPVGGLKMDDAFAAGDSIETVLRNMLDPLKYPSLTNPKATLTASGGTLYEVGSTPNVTLNATLDRGSISPAYGTNGYRVGAATSYQLRDGSNNNVGAAASTGTFADVAVSGANKTFNVEISYEAGQQPKDSHGGDYDNPMPAASVVSSNLTFEFVYCLWSNKNDITTMAKHAATKNKVFELAFPAQTVANPEKFSIPASWTVSKIEALNDLSGKYENCASEFTATDETRQDAGGNDVAYKLYTDNRGYNAGPRTVKVTIA